MTNRDDLPALGTAEAAMQSCVRLIASVTAQPTELMGYYLDLYYQVRHTYEIEVGAEDEPQRIYREDLEPVLQAVLETALHKIATDEAKRRQAKKERIAPSEANTTPAYAPVRNDDKEGDGADKTAPPRKPGLSGFEAVTPPKKPGPWTLYKRQISARLADARAAGVSIASIAAASGGVLGEYRVMDALNAGQLSREEWHALERALDQTAAQAAGK